MRSNYRHPIHIRKNAKYITRKEAVFIAEQAFYVGMGHGRSEERDVYWDGKSYFTGNEFTDWIKEEHPNLITPLTPQN